MEKPAITRPPKTPCVGICSTTSFGDLVCRGCKRYNYEVIAWNSYDAEQKAAVLARLEQLQVQILQGKLEIESRALLEAALKRLSIPYDASLSPYCWVHNLLKKGHRQLPGLQHAGLRALPEYQRLGVTELGELVENELQLLSEAHHQRYLAPSA